MTRSFLPSVLLVLAATPAGAVSVDAVPNPRPNGWVVDMVGVLPPADRQALETLGDEVKAQTGAELAVVVVSSTDGVPHRQFATDLANLWGLGDREKDNGVLVFAALDDRAAEITLGEGIDEAGPVTIALAVMQGEMVPRFRAGDPAEAIFAGALACARRILGARPSIASRPSAAAAPAVALPPAESFLPQAVASPAQYPAYAVADPGHLRTSSPIRDPLAKLALLVGVGIALIGGGRYYYRRRARRCAECLIDMVPLDETEDDAHLSSGERAEERMGSVDYDVWLCLRCGAVKKLRFGAFFTGYATCPKCDARTVSSAERTELSATEWQEGLVRVEEWCQHCDHRSSCTRTIPRMERERSSSSSRAWSSSSSFHSSSSGRSSSSSSSSSSRGGGGGSSAGSGASGRW